MRWVEGVMVGEGKLTSISRGEMRRGEVRCNEMRLSNESNGGMRVGRKRKNWFGM